MTRELRAEPDNIRAMADDHLDDMAVRSGQAATDIVGGVDHAADGFGPPSIFGADNGALWTELVDDLERLLTETRQRIGMAQANLRQLAYEYELVDQRGSEAQRRAVPDDHETRTRR